MKIAEHRIVGAMVAPRGKAPFDRANVVIASAAPPVILWQVQAYTGSDEFEGKPLTEGEWRALVKSEQAIDLVEAVVASSGATFWVMRPGFDGRDAALSELATTGVLLRDALRLPDGSFGCLVNEGRREAHDLRDRWAAKAFEEALSWARSDRWERARVAASRAFVLERAMTPERIAMLALAHERTGNTTRAAGYVEMARRSRGPDFAAQIIEKRADLEQEIQQAPPASDPRPRSATAIHAANDNALKGGLRRLRRHA